VTLRLRAGIAGTGFIAAVHAHAVRAAGGQVVAVLGSNPDRTAAAVDLLGATRGAADIEELASATDVDVVHICTPNHLHVPLSEAALAAGKHVVCEKPLAADASGARHLLDLAASQPAAAGPLTALVSQQDLANSVGSVREVIARVLAELRADRLIRTSPGRVEILDPVRMSRELWSRA